MTYKQEVALCLFLILVVGPVTGWVIAMLQNAGVL